MREFRALRSARRPPRPPLRRLLKKAGENFRHFDSANTFVSKLSGNRNWLPLVFYENLFNFHVRIVIFLLEVDGLGDLLGVEEDLSLVIQNGSASVFGEDTQTFTFADGKLNIPSPDAETPALEQIIELLEDGTVAYTLMGFQIVFTAAEAAGE